MPDDRLSQFCYLGWPSQIPDGRPGLPRRPSLFSAPQTVVSSCQAAKTINRNTSAKKAFYV
ncbi:unnamed protein product, partial [Sphenostylis stenocarpa]